MAFGPGSFQAVFQRVREDSATSQTGQPEIVSYFKIP
jgi:hypothetical protein